MQNSERFHGGFFGFEMLHIFTRALFKSLFLLKTGKITKKNQSIFKKVKVLDGARVTRKTLKQEKENWKMKIKKVK